MADAGGEAVAVRSGLACAARIIRRFSRERARGRHPYYRVLRNDCRALVWAIIKAGVRG